MNTTLDARGLACPLPAVKARRALAAVPPGGALDRARHRPRGADRRRRGGGRRRLRVRRRAADAGAAGGCTLSARAASTASAVSRSSTDVRAGERAGRRRPSRATPTVRHARREAGGHARRRSPRSRRSAPARTPSRSRRGEEHVGRGLAVRDLVARDGDRERAVEPGARERAVEPRPRRGGRDRDRDAARRAAPRTVSSASRTARARRRSARTAVRVGRPERVRRRQPGDPLREVRVHAQVRQADQAGVLRVVDRVAVGRQRPVPRGAGERLGVDQRAVAVEDDRRRAAGRGAVTCVARGTRSRRRAPAPASAP